MFWLRYRTYLYLGLSSVLLLVQFLVFHNNETGRLLTSLLLLAWAVYIIWMNRTFLPAAQKRLEAILDEECDPVRYVKVVVPL